MLGADNGDHLHDCSLAVNQTTRSAEFNVLVVQNRFQGTTSPSRQPSDPPFRIDRFTVRPRRLVRVRQPSWMTCSISGSASGFRCRRRRLPRRRCEWTRSRSGHGCCRRSRTARGRGGCHQDPSGIDRRQERTEAHRRRINNASTTPQQRLNNARKPHHGVQTFHQAYD